MNKEIYQEATLNDRIAQRAYEIYLERGCPEGQHLEHWAQAEQELSAAKEQPAGSKIVSALQSSS